MKFDYMAAAVSTTAFLASSLQPGAVMPCLAPAAPSFAEHERRLRIDDASCRGV